MGAETKEPREAVTCKTISLAEAAKELGFSPNSIVEWAKAGKLQIFVPPGKSLGDGRRGPKGYKIFLTDWELFKAANTQTGLGSGVVNPMPNVGPSGPATGPDGIRRKRLRKTKP